MEALFDHYNEMGKSFPELEVLKPLEETNISGTSGSGTGYGTGSGSDSISNFDSVSMVAPRTNTSKRLQHETNLAQTWTPRSVQIPASEDFRPAFGSQGQTNDLNRRISAQEINTQLKESPRADYIMPRPINDKNLRSRFRVKHNFDSNEVCLNYTLINSWNHTYTILVIWLDMVHIKWTNFHVI